MSSGSFSRANLILLICLCFHFDRLVIAIAGAGASACYPFHVLIHVHTCSYIFHVCPCTLHVSPLACQPHRALMPIRLCPRNHRRFCLSPCIGKFGKNNRATLTSTPWRRYRRYRRCMHQWTNGKHNSFEVSKLLYILYITMHINYN